MNDRKKRLERCGKFYAENGWAVAWTDGIDGEAAKRVTTKGWQNTEPLDVDPTFAAAFFATRGAGKNPAIVARPSGLILVECDSLEDIRNFKALGDYPLRRDCEFTTIVQSSSLEKRHYYFKAHGDCEFVGFRFEGGNVTASRNMYLVAPPALHPSGVEYKFLSNGKPVLMSDSLYEKLVSLAGESEEKVSHELQEDPSAKVPRGNRRTHIFKLACSLRGRGVPLTEALRVAIVTNRERCSPPLTLAQLEQQVEGAYGRYEGATVREFEPEEDQPVVRLIPITDIKAESVEFLVEEPRVPVGNLTLVQGMPGIGKSTWVSDIAAKVTQRGGKVVFSTEEYAPQLKARLSASGADLDYVQTSEERVLLPRDISQLEDLVRAQEISLVVIDPLFGHFSAGIDANSDQSVRKALDPLADMAQRTRCTVIVISHMNKANVESFMLRGSGSLAIMGATASGLMMDGPPDDKIRYIYQFKARHTGHQPPKEVLLEELFVDVDGLSIQTARIKPPIGAEEYAEFARAAGLL